MEAKFTRKCFLDEWVTFNASPLSLKLRRPTSLLSRVLQPIPGTPYTFTNYVLGFRCEATQAEMDLIKANKLFGQAFISIHAEDPPITFADILGPEWLPEVSSSQGALLQVEARVRFAAVSWTHFFESMSADD